MGAALCRACPTLAKPPTSTTPTTPMPPEGGRLKEDAQEYHTARTSQPDAPGGHCLQTRRAAKPHKHCRRRDPAAPRNTPTTARHGHNADAGTSTPTPTPPTQQRQFWRVCAACPRKQRLCASVSDSDSESERCFRIRKVFPNRKVLTRTICCHRLPPSLITVAVAFRFQIQLK